jgi:acyl-CoA synthetase (NDP forming)
VSGPPEAEERIGPAQPSLAPMLEADSVAVVGASARPGSFGEQMMLQLVRGGFDGRIHPVNPQYPEVMGLPCSPSLAALPGPVDLAILGVGNARLEEQMQAAADAGIRSAVIFASCYEKPRPGVVPLRDRLARTAIDAGMTICGGNGMGFVNLERRLRACGFLEPEDLPAGRIAFVTHSGSVFSALLHNDRGIRFNVVVSSGLELTTTTAEYMHFALGLESTCVIGLFIESIRDVDTFLEALRIAADRGVWVVALKVGREELAGDMVEAHSGALAGEDGAYDAVFDAFGVVRVRTLDEMADTLDLMQADRPAGQGGLAAVHDSGGERAHLIDVASDVGVPFARISPDTVRRLEATLEEGLPAINPLDAWGTGRDHERIFSDCIHALLDDPDVAALALVVDLTTQDVPEEGYVAVAKDAFASTAKPFAVLSNLPAAIDPRDARSLRAAGVPILEGTASGLAAIGHLLEHRDFLARGPVRPPGGPPGGVTDRWRRRLEGGGPFDEVEALELLADYGIAVAACERAGDVEEAVDAARRLGFPVAIKTAEHHHKTGVDGVRVGIAGEEELRRAYRELSGRLGPGVTVAAMAPPGVEMALGVARDRQFGPLVMAAAGGVLIEAIRDRRFAVPPLDGVSARRLIDRLSVRPLLDGVRGSAPADIDALAEALSRLSILALELGDLVEALDVNPLIVGPSGSVAVDALVVPRRRG